MVLNQRDSRLGLDRVAVRIAHPLGVRAPRCGRPILALCAVLAATCFATASRGFAATHNGALQVQAVVSKVDPESLRAGSDATWRAIPTSEIHLNRTPPLYEGDPLDDGSRVTAHVAIAESNDMLFVRLVWTDSTDSNLHPPQRWPDAGAQHIYKQHSEDIQRFADAACVMVPRQTGSRPAFPSLMMGEPDAPVDLYYWHQQRGFEHLQAAGRGTTQPTGETIPGHARRTTTGWTVVLQLPVPPLDTPMAVAVWDGARGHRDGLKFFSVWYEISFEGPM